MAENLKIDKAVPEVVEDDAGIEYMPNLFWLLLQAVGGTMQVRYDAVIKMPEDFSFDIVHDDHHGKLTIIAKPTQGKRIVTPKKKKVIFP